MINRSEKREVSFSKEASFIHQRARREIRDSIRFQNSI
jgi:hypothetical protein